MRTLQRIRKHAPRLLLTLTVFMALSLSMFAPVVSADTTSYTATQIHDWLVDQISSATVVMTDATTVILNSGDYGVDPESNYVRVDGVGLNVLGVSIGLSPIKFMFEPGTTNVLIRAELDLLGISPAPKLECTATVACVGPGGPLEVTSIAGVKIGSFEPTLSNDDLNAIVDVLNQIIVASGLSVTPPSASLTGISIVNDAGTDKVQLSWSEGDPTYLESADILAKVNSMVGTLETKATSFLQAGEGDWNIYVDVVSGTSLDIGASLTAFGVTAEVDIPIVFSVLTATITNATFAIGDDAPKTGTFSAEALVGCSNYIPFVTMQSFALGGAHSNLNAYVAQIEETILTAIDDAFDDIVAYTALDWPYYSISDIAVVGTNVVLTSSGTESLDIRLLPGWSMVSVPVVPDDPAPTAVFAGAAAVYTWDPQAKSYVVPLAVVPKQGYWVYVTSDRTIQVTGAPVTEWQSQLLRGWNMVGSIYTDSVLVQNLSDNPADSIVRNAVYRWDPVLKSYIAATAVEPGKGYWMTTVRDCTLSMP